jgi:hypothetical protein
MKMGFHLCSAEVMGSVWYEDLFMVFFMLAFPVSGSSLCRIFKKLKFISAAHWSYLSLLTFEDHKPFELRAE